MPVQATTSLRHGEVAAGELARVVRVGTSASRSKLESTGAGRARSSRRTHERGISFCPGHAGNRKAQARRASRRALPSSSTHARRAPPMLGQAWATPPLWNVRRGHGERGRREGRRRGTASGLASPGAATPPTGAATPPTARHQVGARARTLTATTPACTASARSGSRADRRAAEDRRGTTSPDDRRTTRPPWSCTVRSSRVRRSPLRRR